MANVLNTDKQIAVIAALAEGSSIRAVERMTGIHRNAIMRHGVRVGQGCTAMMDAKMRDIPCKVVWDGIVGVFRMRDRPQTNRIHAWAHDTDNPKHPERYVTVLHIPPVD